MQPKPLYAFGRTGVWVGLATCEWFLSDRPVGLIQTQLL